MMLVSMILITTVILLITFVLTYVFFMRWIRFCRVALRELAEVLGTEPSLDIWTVSATVHGKMQDRPFSVRFSNQTRSSPPAVTVRVPVESPVTMTARRPNVFDRWCAAVGLASPIVTEDPDFNGRIQVDTGNREWVRLLLEDYRFRERLLGLFNADVLRVTCDKNGLSVVQKLRPRETVDPSLVFDTLPRLWDLAECMTLRADPRSQTQISTNQAMMRWGLAPGLFLIIGLTLFIIGMELFEPLYPVFSEVLLQTIPWGLSAGAAYGLSTWLFIRARTDRHLVILVILAFALPGCCLGAMGWMYFGNGWLDKGQPRQYEAVVWETFSKGRGGRKIVFMAEGKPSAAFSRPRGAFPRGLPVRMTVYPGRYGISWVDRWQVVHGATIEYSGIEN